EPGLQIDFRRYERKIRISRGMLFPRFAFMDALKKVSALMAIDFNRCNICIADASTELGIIMAELVMQQGAFLTLCTLKKGEVMKRVDGNMKKTGISPAVVSDFKKAIMGCDILIYTGNTDMRRLTS